MGWPVLLFLHVSCHASVGGNAEGLRPETDFTLDFTVWRKKDGRKVEVASVELGLLCHSTGACPEQASQHWTPWGGTSLRTWGDIQIHSLSVGPRVSFSEYGRAVPGVYSLSAQSSLSVGDSRQNMPDATGTREET